MENEDIVNYVMDNPDNTNPAVLRDMLSQLSGGGGSLPFDVFVIETTKISNQHILTKTAGEIIEAANGGALVLMNLSDWEVNKSGSPWGILKYANDNEQETNRYTFQFSNYEYNFLCSEASDYPEEDMG